jgi:hypothetical protein
MKYYKSCQIGGKVECISTLTDTEIRFVCSINCSNCQYRYYQFCTAGINSDISFNYSEGEI